MSGLFQFAVTAAGSILLAAAGIVAAPPVAGQTLPDGGTPTAAGGVLPQFCVIDHQARGAALGAQIGRERGGEHGAQIGAAIGAARGARIDALCRSIAERVAMQRAISQLVAPTARPAAPPDMILHRSATAPRARHDATAALTAPVTPADPGRGANAVAESDAGAAPPERCMVSSEVSFAGDKADAQVIGRVCRGAGGRLHDM